MKNSLFLWLILLAVSTRAQEKFKTYVYDKNATPREHNADIIHMKVEVSFDAPKGKVTGKVTHTFNPLRPQVDTLFWDGPGITVLKTTLTKNGKPVQNQVNTQTTDAGIVNRFTPPLKWDNTYELTFEYEAYPRKGIYFIGWNSPENTDNRNQTRRQIWTQGQGIDNRYWIPMYDQGNDKFVTETVVTFLNGYKVLSNGELKECKDNKNGTTTWHYLMPKPHAGYLLMLAIDKYEIKKTNTKRGTPVQFWYYPEHTEKVAWTSIHTEKIIEFLEDETGFAYPWGSYSQVMVQDFLYGAMENTSATIFGDFFNVDSRGFLDRNYIGVNAHELTHQWFGDLITARSAEGTWLQESFATYYAKLFMKDLYGDDEFAWNHRGEVQSALAAGEKDNLPVAHSASGTSRVYPKGSAIIQMMRYVLGDEGYKRMINHYLKQHAFGNVETNDLNQAIQDVLGISMDWFFDQWILRGGEPHYKVNWIEAPKQTLVQVEQIQNQNLTTGLFKMPVNIAVYYTDGTHQTQKVWIEEVFHSIAFTNDENKKVSFVLFDVNGQILKKLTFDKSYEELSNQLLLAPDMLDRHWALEALNNIATDKKRKLLQQSYEKETLWAMKAEIIKQLCNDPDSKNFLKLVVLNENDARVKRSFLSYAKPADFTDLFIKALSDSSYSNVELALDKLVAANPLNNYSAYLNPVSGTLGQNHNIRIKWLEYSLLHIKQDAIAAELDKQLISYSSNSYEFRTRIAAMTAIKHCNLFNETLVENLVNAGYGTNRRLASPAIELLRYLGEDQYKASTIKKVYSQLTEEQKKWLKENGYSL